MILASIALVLPNISLSKEERRIALVIGNGSYKSSPLANPVNDANDIATALERCNFTVMKAINAPRNEIRRAIREFGEEINKGAVGLFYYAGHGIQVKGENYLVPVGVDVYSEAEVEDECLKVSSVLRQMESAGNRLNIIILDACRDNPFGRSFRSSNRGLAKMDAPTGSILAYATAPGSVAEDGIGRNGLYTSKLLKHMRIPGLEIGKLFRQIRIDVMDASGKRQVPWELSSLTGEFYFIPERGIAVVKRPKKEPKRPKRDEGLDKEREQLESERLELERLKAEIERRKLEAERKSLEAEKKKLEMVKLSPTPSLKEIARDGRFRAYDNGTVKDTRTGLMWASKDNGRTVTWQEAKAYCENYRGGRYTDWRLPTQDELARLYDRGKDYRVKKWFLYYHVHLTELIELTACKSWTSETRGSKAACFDFQYGGRHWAPQSGSYVARALPVRAGN